MTYNVDIVLNGEWRRLASDVTAVQSDRLRRHCLAARTPVRVRSVIGG